MPTNFRLWSPEFSDQGKLSLDHEFNGFGGNGQNISPRLEWENPPADTKSFALTVYDPDAPTGSGFWHWVIFNIPSDLRVIEQNAGTVSTQLLPSEAIQLHNDYGFAGYGGALPPVGDPPHPYQFVLHALSVERLDINAETTNAVARFLMSSYVIENAMTVGYYQR
ncbi:PEBP family protein [Rippkaea orientalis PCC 8801]|uniref:PEBP family protein n=1 Tax=Rippkaea orientalis (strain PCC 8801 / RF-1) TaxID=41431 RepID=B7K4T9_RIPO1|nr:YbhB/YbcL family Raf kinase inhibitor-like protein [Rippkaea orientalis]ACK66595.1 PEBP family protein [Rippkaea orientalis PCC 8801]